MLPGVDYAEQVRDIQADKRGRIIPSLPLRKVVLDLSVARNAAELKCSGDFIFLDRNSTGVINVSLRSPQEDQMPMGAFDIIENVPMDRIFITHAAQPGLVANLWYGYHARFRASSANLSTLGSITNTVSVQDVSMLPGTEFSSLSLITAGTPLNVIAAASNLNGLRVHDAGGSGLNTTSFLAITLLAKATAPTTVADGAVIANTIAQVNNGTTSWAAARLLKPRRVAAGLRLDWMVSATDIAPAMPKGVSYDVL